MNSSQQETGLYTAVQIARAINGSVWTTRRALNNVEPTGSVIINGKSAQAWALNELPKKLQDDLEQTSINRGFKTVERLIQNPPQIWEPSIDGTPTKLSDIVDHCIHDAAKLQKALLPSLTQIINSYPSRTEIEDSGLRDYRTVFKKTISVRHWWRLVNRTLNRDKGANDFTRLDIYLSRNLARKIKRIPSHSSTSLSLNNLQRALVAVENPSSPTSKEVNFVWDQAFFEFKCYLDSGEKKAKCKRAIIKTLDSSGVKIADSYNALKRNFNRKFEKWNAGECKPSAILDKRKLSAGERKFILPEEDRRTLLARTVERGCRLSQAWRYCLNEGELTSETTLRYISNPYSKSYVPRCVRDQIKYDAKMLKDLHHGPRQNKLNGAYISPDHSDTHAGDWYQADDVTLNHYYYEETPEEITSMRGQCLLFIDVRTNYILGFSLHSERNYNARIIRETITKIHDTYGLPREGFYF